MSEEPEYVEAICVPFADSGRLAWRYSLCRPHADEAIAKDREAGGDGFWHLFRTDRGWCQWCHAIEVRPEKADGYYPMNQTPLVTVGPEPVPSPT